MQLGGGRREGFETHLRHVDCYSASVHELSNIDAAAIGAVEVWHGRMMVFRRALLEAATGGKRAIAPAMAKRRQRESGAGRQGYLVCELTPSRPIVAQENIPAIHGCDRLHSKPDRHEHDEYQDDRTPPLDHLPRRVVRCVHRAAQRRGLVICDLERRHGYFP
jgi:hypothetical protein